MPLMKYFVFVGSCSRPVAVGHELAFYPNPRPNLFTAAPRGRSSGSVQSETLPERVVFDTSMPICTGFERYASCGTASTIGIYI